MVRPLRIEFEGALYHLCVRGNERQKIFRDEEDYAKFMAMWMVWENCGMSLREIGELCGGLSYAAGAAASQSGTKRKKGGGQNCARMLKNIDATPARKTRDAFVDVG